MKKITKAINYLVQAGLITGCLLINKTALASTVDMSLSEKSVGLGVQQKINSNAAAHLSLLYHTQKGGMVNLGFDATDESDDIYGSLGIKFFAANLRKNSKVSGGAAPGGSIGMHIKDNMRVETSLYYTPGVLSFNGAGGMNQFDSRFIFVPMPNAELAAGYRNFSEIHRGLYLGLSFRY